MGKCTKVCLLPAKKNRLQQHLKKLCVMITIKPDDVSKKTRKRAMRRVLVGQVNAQASTFSYKIKLCIKVDVGGDCVWPHHGICG
jgi:hypothetical protein